MSYSASQRQCLLDLARDSIRHGLDKGGPLQVSEATVEAELWLQRASFVTLHEAGQLRGCIGSLEARRPLARDVCENAFNAAFRDPRFPALRDAEFAEVDISISVLSESEPLSFNSEADLIEKLRPGTDGLILSDQGRRGTFLPAVWEQLPDPADFLRHLKQKAGLRADYWSSTIQVQRYSSESF
jgi:AmmeMemoRadiSam system protein A